VRTSTRISRAAALLLVVGLLAGGCALGPTETRDDRFAVGDSVRLIVDGVNGSIEVTAAAAGEVRIQATIRGANRIEYDVTQNGDTITAIGRRTGWALFSGGAGVSFVIAVPTQADMDLETSNGPIRLSGVDGSGSLETSNGKIVLEDVKGVFDGDTSNGSITIDGLEGSARFDTSNARVDLREVVGEVDVETSNGRIFYSGDMLPGGRNRLATSNGDVDVELYGAPSIDVDASTSRGRVSSEFPILVTATREGELTGTIGAGEADLFIRTSNGSVSIRGGP
jgi:hypothetical protein